MKTKTFVFAVLLSLCLFHFPSSTFATDNNPINEYDPYNPPLGIFLSVVSPGLGQIYAGKLGKGISIWTGTTCLSGAFLITVADISFTSTGGFFPVNLGFVLKDELSPTEKTWAWTLGAAYAALYIYNVLDISVYDPDRIQFEADSDNVSVNYTWRF